MERYMEDREYENIWIEWDTMNRDMDDKFEVAFDIFGSIYAKDDYDCINQIVEQIEFKYECLSEIGESIVPVVYKDFDSVLDELHCAIIYLDEQPYEHNGRTWVKC